MTVEMLLGVACASQGGVGIRLASRPDVADVPFLPMRGDGGAGPSHAIQSIEDLLDAAEFHAVTDDELADWEDWESVKAELDAE